MTLSHGRRAFSQFARRAACWTIDAAQRGVRGSLAASTALPQATMDLVFPPACVSCRVDLNGAELRVPGVPLCDECYESLDLLCEPWCRRCGGPLPALSRSPQHEPELTNSAGCYRCRGRKIWFEETIAAGLYNGLLRDLVLEMKTKSGDSVTMAMSRLLVHLRREQFEKLQVDVVVPIPMHWRRRVVHRTNSAAVLAEGISQQLRVPLAEGLLRRRRHTPPQSELTPSQRWDNVRQAFSVRPSYHLRDAHVLLVDDILTTGATCSEAARTLIRAGAGRVSVAVIARAIGD